MVVLSIRAPMLSIKSEFCRAKFVPRGATVPGFPMYNSSSYANRSTASHVAMTGMPSASLNSRISDSAWESRTPFPASSTGRSEAFNSSMVWATD